MGRHSHGEASSSASEHDAPVLDPFSVAGLNVDRPLSMLATSDTRKLAIDSISRMIDLIDRIDHAAAGTRAAQLAAQRDDLVDFRRVDTLCADLAQARAEDSVDGRRRFAASDGAVPTVWADNANHGWFDYAIVNSMTNEDLSVLKRAQELVRKHDEEQRAQRIQREGRVRQTASLIATYSADCSLRLAELLDFTAKDGPVDKISWQLSASGEKLISFNPEDNDLMVDMHRMPMLVTDVEGYTVGVQHLLGTDVYAFGLTDGGDNWSGFEDLEGFGRATLTPGNRYKAGEVALSQYNQ